jgi:predicted metal-dependent hydrolase
MDYNDIINSLSWPPIYTLKKSARTRHIKLKASARYGLELVVPLRFNQKTIPDILETNKQWIEKQLAKIQLELNTLNQQILPSEILLPLLNQSWRILYLKGDSKKLRLLINPNHELILFGNTDDKNNCKKLLNIWVKNQAKTFITERLAYLSQKTGLSYSSSTIRNQRSRWGSCSSNKSINLNFKLLFLPTPLVDHIIIHELCHTIHMNHSGKFWRLVASFDSNWKQHCRDTRQADKLIPAWAREI